MPNLRNSLDRDVYQIVRKYEDDYTNETGKAPPRVTITAVYEYIQRSNSSLKRQKKRPLEDSIERALAVRKEEQREDRDTDEELERELQAKAAGAKRSREEKDASIINRHLTKHWNFNNNNNNSNNNTNSSAASSTGAKTPTAQDAMDIDSGSAQPTVDRQPDGESKPKRRRKDPKEIDRSPPQDINLDDIAGLDKALDRLWDFVYIPLRLPRLLSDLGVQLSGGVLLHGPSGCGKTTLAHALAAELRVAFIPVSTPSLVGGTSGESEKNIRDIFDEAMRLAPCMVFFDELDSIAGKKDGAQKAMEGRIVAEICHGMDRLGRRRTGGSSANTSTGVDGNIVVLAATNRPDSIDATVRGRFAVEVDIGMPNELAREKILRSMTRNLKLGENVDFAALARLTPGYVGADLKHVVIATGVEAARAYATQGLGSVEGPVTDEPATGSMSEPASSSAVRKFRAEIESSPALGSACVSMAHFRTAINKVQPAAKREGFTAIPDTTWAHVGALAEVRKKLEMSIIGPIKYPERFARVGIKAAAGILLWGPPGCGKTLVAKAVANESKANFISIKGPELLNKYVGESERAVRSLFSRARSSAPCILFFDEMDALVPKRDDSLSDASSRVVNALLTEMDGVEDRNGIYVVGATNRPDCIDPAIRRPGRLGTSVFVGLPTAVDRIEILKAIYWNTITGGQGDRAKVEERLAAIALDRRCEGFSGADLGSLMQAAARASLERTYHRGGGDISMDSDNGGEDEISGEDWEKALNDIKPSVKDDGRYDPAQFDNGL